MDKKIVIFCDQIMSMGFVRLLRQVSRSVRMMVIPESKWSIVNDTRGQVTDFEQQYMDGLITQARNTIKSSMLGQNVMIKLLMR